jgi:ADP-ribose pyrophosphatase
MKSSENIIRILEEVPVYGNAYGTLFDDRVEFTGSETTGRYVRWCWNAPYSVAVLPLLDPETALLVRNFRHAVRGVVLEAPKGFGRPGESPEEVASRELEEELGLTCSQLERLGATQTDPAFVNHTTHLFLATSLAEGCLRREASESIQDVCPVRIRGARELLGKGEIMDAVTLLLLAAAEERLRV